MTVLRMLESLRVPAMDGLMQAVTELGSEVFFLVVALVLFWCVSKREGYYLLTVGFFRHGAQSISEAPVPCAPALGDGP